MGRSKELDDQLEARIAEAECGRDEMLVGEMLELLNLRRHVAFLEQLWCGDNYAWVDFQDQYSDYRTLDEAIEMALTEKEGIDDDAKTKREA